MALRWKGEKGGEKESKMREMMIKGRVGAVKYLAYPSLSSQLHGACDQWSYFRDAYGDSTVQS